MKKWFREKLHFPQLTAGKIAQDTNLRRKTFNFYSFQ